jgi:hypothetical protein
LGSASIVIPVIRKQLHTVLISIIVGFTLFPETRNTIERAMSPPTLSPGSTPILPQKIYFVGFDGENPRPPRQWSRIQGRTFQNVDSNLTSMKINSRKINMQRLMGSELPTREGKTAFRKFLGCFPVPKSGFGVWVFCLPTPFGPLIWGFTRLRGEGCCPPNARSLHCVVAEANP